MKRDSKVQKKTISSVYLFAVAVFGAIISTVCGLFVLPALADTNTVIPRVGNTVVAIIGDVETATQGGYPSLANAMTDIGDGTDDYTIVFVQNYTMIHGTDRDTMETYG